MGEKKDKSIVNSTTIGMAQNQNVQKHGEAASQIIQAYKGARYDSKGRNLNHQGRSLKKISEYSVGKGDSIQQQKVIKSQAGFSAELLKEAHDNKEAILQGETARTRTTDGIGSTNHTQYDHILVDENNKVISNSGSQMKFYGIDKKGRYSVVEKMVKDKSWDRYDSVIDIPNEQYEGALKYADEQARKFYEQADRLKANGKYDLSKQKETLAKRYETVKERLRNSKISTESAIEARLNPRKVVAKEVISDSNKAGISAAKAAMIMGGTIAIGQNLYAIITEEKDLEEAVKDVTSTIMKTGGVSYLVAGSGTAVKAVMHSSEHEVIRNLGNTSAPVAIATASVEIVKSIKKYAEGDIDEEQLIEELGEKGVGMLSAGYGAAVGATVGGVVGSVVPIVGTEIGAVVGGFVGNIMGYTLSGIFYKGALEALEGAKVSAERRTVIEELCKYAIEEEKRYQQVLETYANAQYKQRQEKIQTFMQDIKESIKENNIEKYILSVNEMGNFFNIEMKFSSYSEIDDFMSDNNTVFEI